MTDYGHELSFGTFITPQNAQPRTVVALAQLTEQVGLDLATFQDHPYQPGFLDTWTLMSYVLAQTERISVSGNVLNLPLRPPAVLARAAASLDLLSGGRLELGLGAGGFWDPIAAMGGPRRTPGEGVDALSEAIDIIRGIWTPSDRSPLRVDGTHYQVQGAKRGPAPAHEIGIWLGAYKPRMLRLTGAKADGWLPSWPYLQPGDAERGNRTIDEAAEEAGRDPREIRRLLNISGSFTASDGGFLVGPPRQWAEQLAALALEQGFGTFILMADDAAAIEMYGNEVAPATRELVAAERRTRGTTEGRVRSSRSLALRAPGIDYDALAPRLASLAVEPGDAGYDKVRSTYIRTGRPGLVVMCETADDVAATLAFARGQDVPLSVRSGGHGISGRSTNTGGIVLDVSRLNAVEVLDPATRRFRTGPGASWGKVAQVLGRHGWAMSSGDYGDVGVGGLATAGGVGWLVRKHGLTIDHVVAAEIVLADGSQVRADADENPDLFWAIRGAGGNFGVVTAFELEAYDVGDVVFAALIVDATDAAAVLERWARYVESAPRELTSFVDISSGRRGQPALARVHAVYAGDDVAAATAAIEPLLTIGPVLEQQAQLVPYPALVAPQGSPHEGQARMASRAGLVEHLTAEVAEAVVRVLDSGAMSALQLRTVGGAVNDVDPAATAYSHRSQNVYVAGYGLPSNADRMDVEWDALAPHLNGLYISFDTDTRPHRLHDAYPEPTLTRLRALKHRYDPENVFNQNFPIPPAD